MGSKGHANAVETWQSWDELSLWSGDCHDVACRCALLVAGGVTAAMRNSPPADQGCNSAGMIQIADRTITTAINENPST
ncbi:hypothetical protein SKP52_12500 [Sphingopyxis fribergensis]|uniref:Uncharacterized protein n=1 Tax=Sphingopyxis fribergensis TaxID=1515612 RepID=A0A0A7PGY6_9SPHN|nr:hypothetical protein SKP52_12500 [Sphingopyxis fribergensis]